MAKYQTNASDVALLLDLTHALDDTEELGEHSNSIVYAFKKLVTNSIHLSVFKDYEKQTPSSFRADAKSFVTYTGVSAEWDVLLEQASLVKTFESVNECKIQALKLLLQNQKMVNDAVFLQDLIEEDGPRHLVMHVSAHTRPNCTIETLKDQILMLEDKELYPISLAGYLTVLHARLLIVQTMYFKIGAIASKAYGVAAENSSIALYNRLHAQKLVHNTELSERVLHVAGSPDILMRGIVDARMGNDIVEIKHRTTEFQNALSTIDKTQIHVYMFIHDKTQCVLLESVSADGMLFTKEHLIRFDEVFWALTKDRLERLLKFTDHLMSDRLFVHLFFTISPTEQARYLRYILSGGDNCVVPGIAADGPISRKKRARAKKSKK